MTDSIFRQAVKKYSPRQFYDARLGRFAKVAIYQVAHQANQEFGGARTPGSSTRTLLLIWPPQQ